MTYEGISEQLPTGSPGISPEGLVLAYDMKTLTPHGEMRDFSPKGNDGSVVGTEAVVGPFGAARAFRKATDYIMLPSKRSLHVRGPITIAAWVKFAQMGVHQHIVAYDDLYTLWIDERDRFRFSDTRGNAFESEARVVPHGTWTALVATFTGRRGTALNGRNISLSVNGSPVSGRAFGVWNPGPSVEGYVGKESHSGQFYLPFLGEIATILIFRRPLSESEARAFATVPSFPPGPQGIPAAGGPTRGRGGPVVRVPPRIVRITNILPPYRLPTLQILQASPLIRFEQWIMAASERNRRWDPPRSTPMLRTFRDWGIDLSHRDMATAHFNPGILWELSSRPPDLVILGGYEHPTCLYAGLLLARKGVPFLLSSESISLEDSVVGRQAPFLVRKLVSRCAGVIVPGRASREHFLDLGVPEERIFVAPNAVDVDRFAPARTPEEKRAAREALGLPDKTLCLYVGRLTRTKGITELLNAFASLLPVEKNLHLVIIGDGLLKAEIQSRVARDPSLRGSVSLVGYAPEELLPQYYLASDIFVFPTQRDIWGLVLNEAMCAGLPVVSSDGAAATLDLLEDGVNGLLVPRADPRALKAALLRLHDDAALRERLGLRARERVLEGFAPSNQAMGFLIAILTTLQGRGETGHDVRGSEALEGFDLG